MQLNLKTKFWSWAGRVLPLTALLLVILLVTVDARAALDYLLIGIATVFGTVAFFWWWWVIDAIHNLNKFFTDSYDRFGDIQSHLREIKKDVGEVKQNHKLELEEIKKSKRKK
ncbi:MAG: hypothetical protein CMA31_01150 [Euryarchaeota archaeon]|nr:hypothetical protein [Euryarchaeota archaeon]|tara:strand:+ start:45 stop:383 length:339 start_codon:yes stop_codon:yes gene_type:complete